MHCGFHLASLPHHSYGLIARPLRDMGYDVVAVRINHAALDTGSSLDQWLQPFKDLRDADLEIVLDADGMFLADPWKVSAPELASRDGNEARESMLLHCIDLAAKVKSQLVTFSVGRGDEDEDDETILRRLAPSISRLVDHATHRRISIAIKPVLGAAIETASQFRRLLQWLPEVIASSAALGWAADVAVMARRGEMPIGDRLERDVDRLICVYVSDMTVDLSADARFGSGDLAIARIVNGIDALPFTGPVIFRVEGHGEAGLWIAKEAIEVIRLGKQGRA